MFNALRLNVRKAAIGFRIDAADEKGSDAYVAEPVGVIVAGSVAKRSVELPPLDETIETLLPSGMTKSGR
jgi:hypothetical protein